MSTYLYNTRLQPCWMYATTGTALATSTLCTATDSTPGNILDLQYNFNPGHDNGNVMGITNNRDTTRTQSFTYDQVNRIVSDAGSTYAQSSGHCWGETYIYDQWANMYAIGVISSSYNGCIQDSLNVSPTANNQLSATGYAYDAAGNMLRDGANSYTYNGESEITNAANVTYKYDGDGNRLIKSSGKIYWYGAGTEILDESDLSGNFTNEYVFFGGKRIAMRNVSSGIIDYYAEDMLGSSRTIVQAGQTSPCYDADFLPFGKELTITATCTQPYKFEGKERDTETGNDDFGARYYSSRLGRWLSADWSAVPAPVPYANLTNPQTLNLYAMVSDNPESFADLDGHATESDPTEVMTQNGVPVAGSGANATTVEEINGQEDAAKPPPPPPPQQNQDDKKSDKKDQTSSGAGGNRTPSTGTPDTTVRVPGARPGSYGERTYGPDGRATKDIDHGHDHTGAGDPHAHDWVDGKRVKTPRALTPEESAGADTHRPSHWAADHQGAILATAAVVLFIGAVALAPATGGASLGALAFAP